MSAEWVTAGATVFTAVVIAASAAAALLQIRHLRKANEIEIIEKWTETIESPQFREARAFVMQELPRILADHERVKSLSWDPLPAELVPARTVCNFFEAVGLFVKLGSVDARVACDLWAFTALECWRAIAPVITFIRERDRLEALWENFEYLAVLSQEQLARRPEGSYPGGMRRMPKDRSLIEVLGSDG